MAVVVYAMKNLSHLLVCGLSLGALGAWAADATSTLDYTQRNSEFAPGATPPITAEKQTPQTQVNEGVQAKRFDKTVVAKPMAVVGERRAPIEMKETRGKLIIEKETRRPEKIVPPTSTYNQRMAPIATGTDTLKPPLVAKYQDSLSAASTTNMARFPAMDRTATATINRFVFRKNPAEAAGSGIASAVTPAAGGSEIRK